MSTRTPTQQTIVISVDSDYTFQYTDLFTGGEAGTVVVMNGDQLAWTLDSAIEWRTFQIDFGAANPFQPGRQFSLRGTDVIVSDPVALPITSTYNRIMKYSVSLGNGWTDDPDVVPVPADTVVIGDGELLLAPKCVISWTDDTESAIYLNPPDITVDATDSGGIAEVSWRWDSHQPDMQPFTLTFVHPIPANWPATTNSVNSGGNPTILLFLPPGLAEPTTFHITTTTRDGNPTTATGTLTIS